MSVSLRICRCPSPFCVLIGHSYIFFCEISHYFFCQAFFFWGLFYVVISALLDLHCCAQAFSSCSVWAGHWGGLSHCGAQALGQVLRLQQLRLLGSLECWLNSRARASLLRGIRDTPGPGLWSVSPAPAGGFLTTEPPGKHCQTFNFILGYSRLTMLW